MRFYFFASKDAQRSSSIKDNFSGIYTNYIRKIDTLSNYNIIILIGAIAILLTLYSVIAYSFLESSSILLFKNNYRTEVHTENSTAFNDSIDTHVYTLTHKNYPLVGGITLLYISKRVVHMDSHESLQNNNKTILS